VTAPGAPTALEGWSGERLDAAARLWKLERRVFTAKFAGESMRPTFAPGQEIRVRCGVSAAAGDVAVCQQRERILVHRVLHVSADSNWMLTRGDSTCVPDLPVRAASVLGTVSGLVLRDGDRPLGPSPDSALRRVVARLSVAGFRSAPAAARIFVQGLWLLRKWLVVMPRVSARRLLGRPAPGKEE
jgi:hypothetical protein